MHQLSEDENPVMAKSVVIDQNRSTAPVGRFASQTLRIGNSHVGRISAQQDSYHLSNNTMAVTVGVTEEMMDSVHSLEDKKIGYWDWKKDHMVIPEIEEHKTGHHTSCNES